MKSSSISTKFVLLIAVLLSISAIAQESYLLNYDDVDLRKITQDIADILGYSIILFIVITAIMIAKNESKKIIIFFVLIMFIEF